MFKTKPYITKLLKPLSVFIICITLTGCGNKAETENSTGINAEEPLEEDTPSCSAMDDKEGTSDAVEATFILDVDTNLYWNFVTDIICHTQHNSTYTYSYFMEINGL